MSKIFMGADGAYANVAGVKFPDQTVQVTAATGGGNSVQAVVDFGTFEPTEDTTARVTVSASWVVANQFLLCSVVEGQDHTDDEVAAEQVTATVGNIQAGVGFDVVLSSLNGSSGMFLVNVRS